MVLVINHWQSWLFASESESIYLIVLLSGRPKNGTSTETSWCHWAALTRKSSYFLKYTNLRVRVTRSYQTWVIDISTVIIDKLCLTLGELQRKGSDFCSWTGLIDGNPILPYLILSRITIPPIYFTSWMVELDIGQGKPNLLSRILPWLYSLLSRSTWKSQRRSNWVLQVRLQAAGLIRSQGGAYHVRIESPSRRSTYP